MNTHERLVADLAEHVLTAELGELRLRRGLVDFLADVLAEKVIYRDDFTVLAEAYRERWDNEGVHDGGERWGAACACDGLADIVNGKEPVSP